ncbi:amidase [Acidovorax soli]|uniref:Amidase/aspartyl-tRNA(Asn)/glutamyl-tRNA(Gln) amidotransferase subunit A n=1 Tax=Acidovorax soli TaxID=592050 RepID=A0A1H3VCV8_9BURK|nr:amidase [Acidovorax soli]SDZ72579.1 amidase/aspartyl-tRNA(Asn)/glutamyl-tRNA(Gln) amidotransferase subunit A [Acidovorax soli]
MLIDLTSTRQRLQDGTHTATAELEQCLDAAQSAACGHAFLRLMPEAVRTIVVQGDPLRLPLAGLSVSVKDLFDIAGQPTTAGSTALADAAPAPHDCPAVARLRSAGGTVIGRTNMVEFAFSGVGVNPHFGTPAAWDGRFGALPGAPRIPGGSSSGAAVSVATGAAFVGLGSDTGGSIRIPAALNGIVGFKNTARLVPTAGAIPLATTLDTACAMTRSVRDAIVVHEVLAARRVTRSPAPLRWWRLAVPSTTFLDNLDATVARAFGRTLDTLRQAGAHIEEIDLPLTAELGPMQAGGSLSAAESHAWHRRLLARQAAQYDPRVRSRIERGATMAAADYIDLLQARQNWIARMEAALAPYDALLSPTVPMVAPPIAEVAPGAKHDAEFFRINALLLRNTSVVNMLDGCALSLPCHVAGELPVGLMVWHAALHDDAVLNVGLQIEQILQK